MVPSLKRPTVQFFPGFKWQNKHSLGFPALWVKITQLGLQAFGSGQPHPLLALDAVGKQVGLMHRGGDTPE